MGKVRCEYCHGYVDQADYRRHCWEHEQLRPDGQQNEYATLAPEERHVGEVTEVPQVYLHRKCGECTGMPEEIIRTYLKNPWFYLSDKTFCTGCGKHVPLSQCVWTETGEDLQTYTDRLRAGKPELRPNAFKLLLARVFNLLG